MGHYTPHLQVNEPQLNRNSQDERGKEIMLFVWGISANGGILGWILHCSRSNINFLNAHSRSIFKNRSTTALMYRLYVATVCVLLRVFWQVQSVIQASWSIKYPPSHLHPTRCKLINIPPVFTVPSSGGTEPSGLGPVWPRTELHIRTFTLTQIKLLKPAKPASQPDEHAWRRSTCSRS